MKSRITLIFLVSMTLWGLIITRAAYLQIIPNERLSHLQKRQFETTVTLQSRRGAIVDRNGQELAVSVRTDSLFADPQLIEKPRQSARRIAKILNLDSDALFKRLASAPKSKRFLWVQRHVNGKAKEKISALKLKGFGFIQESKRIYPNGTLLANTLGFVGQEGQGLEGLEARYDEKLRKRSRQVSLPRDARGRPLLMNDQYFADNLDGSDLELTIDREIQFVLERELAQTVQAHEALSAVGVILDVKTAEILALAQVPTFNPNSPLLSPPDTRRNRIITDAYEPGSVIKPMVAAGALAAKVVGPNTRFDCEGGRLKVGAHVIREAEAHEQFGLLTVSEILAFSSNVGMTKLAFAFGAPRVHETLSQFGFGQRTGVDLPGEARGILHAPPWRPHHFANISFGHGLSATALQVANAYLTIASGGVLRTPVLVKSIRDLQTGQKQTFAATEIRRVLQPADAEKVTLMLTGATAKGGTGYRARVTGYPVAGKTGTAQKVDPEGKGYLKGAYISSFAGFVPAHDPRYAIYVAVDGAKKNYYAAATAAPVFSKVAGFALRKALVPPVFISEQNLIPKPLAKAHKAVKLAPSVKESDDRVPNLVGLSLREVYQKLSSRNVMVKTVGEGWVVRTEPSASEEFAKGRKLTLFLESKD